MKKETKEKLKTRLEEELKSLKKDRHQNQSLMTLKERQIKQLKQSLPQLNKSYSKLSSLGPSPMISTAKDWCRNKSRELQAARKELQGFHNKRIDLTNKIHNLNGLINEAFPFKG